MWPRGELGVIDLDGRLIGIGSKQDTQAESGRRPRSEIVVIGPSDGLDTGQ